MSKLIAFPTEMSSSPKATKVVGNAATTIGGALGLAGLFLAPFTAGASLGLTIAGGVIGAAGGATSLTASIIEKKWDKKENHKVQKAIEIN